MGLGIDFGYHLTFGSRVEFVNGFLTVNPFDYNRFFTNFESWVVHIAGFVWNHFILSIHNTFTGSDMDDFFNRLFRNLFRSCWISDFQLTLSGPSSCDFFVSFHASLNNFLFAQWKSIIFNNFSCVWDFDVFFFRYGAFDTAVNNLGAHVFGNMLRCRNWISYFLTFLGLVGCQNFFFTCHSFDGDFFFPFHHAFILDDFSSKRNWFLFGLSGLTTDTDMNDFINRFFDDMFTVSCLIWRGRLWYFFKGVAFLSFGFTNFENTWRSPRNGVVFKSEGIR